MFLVAIVLILSLFYGALEWNVPLSAGEDGDSIEEFMEDIDFDKLKKDLDMVAAVQDSPPPEAVKTVVAVAEEELQTDMEERSDEVENGNDGGEGDETAEEEEPAEILSTPLNDRESLVVMERLPEFPGGAAAFMKWITANLKYPKTAQDKKIKGKVVVSFIVDEEGNATNLKIEKTDNRLLGNAVLAVMGNMPKWKPGVQDGKICETMIRIPVNFEL